MPPVFVSDLGNVLLHCRHQENDEKFVQKCSAPPEAIGEFFKSSSAFHDYERGAIGTEEFFEGLRSILGYRDGYKEFRRDFCDMFRQYEESYALICGEIKLRMVRRGGEMWMLSNINELHRDYLRATYPGIFVSFWELFLSCEIGARKPDPEIYKYMLKKTGRKAEECVFVDDILENIRSFEKLGGRGILFRGPQNLRATLEGRFDIFD